MSESQFALLCAKINDVVGPGEFRPAQQNEGKKLISGEVRVAVGLRMLCGGSYMDYVGRIYGLRSVYSVYLCLEKLIEWLNKTFEFPLVTLLKEFEKGTVEATKKLSEMSDDFASESNGFFGGCIGALDGLAIRIVRPANVPDAGNYFCRKNFYAINVQAICDKKKKIYLGIISPRICARLFRMVADSAARLVGKDSTALEKARVLFCW